MPTPGAAWGADGRQLLIQAPDRVRAAVLVSTGARTGKPQAWADRAAAVRDGGTAVVAAGSTERWFATATRREQPDLASALRASTPEGDAQTCEALSYSDVSDELVGISARVLAVAGEEDVANPVP